MSSCEITALPIVFITEVLSLCALSSQSGRWRGGFLSPGSGLSCPFATLTCFHALFNRSLHHSQHGDSQNPFSFLRLLHPLTNISSPLSCSSSSYLLPTMSTLVSTAVHTYDPIFSGGRGRRLVSLRSAQAKLVRPYLKNKNMKQNKAKRLGA
jgi:hypothetical protein